MQHRLTLRERQARAPKIASLIKARMLAMGITRLDLAQRCGVPWSQFNTTLSDVDVRDNRRILRTVSKELGWNARYLPGLASGEFRLDQNPDTLPPEEVISPQRPGTTDRARIAELSSLVGELYSRLSEADDENHELRSRLAALERAVFGTNSQTRAG